MATIIDNSGRIVKKEKINSGNQWIYLSNLAVGVYFVQLIDGTVLKFLK